jgi:1,4-alpha-glucan branching enzyme
MIAFSKNFNLLSFAKIDLVHAHNENMVLVFLRAGLLLAFNFHPTQSYPDYRLDAHPGKYRMVFNSDQPEYGGHGRLAPDQVHFTASLQVGDQNTDRLSLYLPTRTAVVLRRDG